VIIIKLEPGELKYPTNLNWNRGQHRGLLEDLHPCRLPGALYEQTTHHILCPCHQSTFDATRGATVLFGPAEPAAAAVADGRETPRGTWSR